jgi:hypothetical protein
MLHVKVFLYSTALIWSFVSGAIAVAQAPTLSETSRRLEKVEDQLAHDQDVAHADKLTTERRLTTIETKLENLTALVEKLNTLLWGVLGSGGLVSVAGVASVVRRKVNTKSASN